MVTTTINLLSLPLFISILMSPYFVPIQSQDPIFDAWVTKCFLEGFDSLNSTSTDCVSIELPESLTSVKELTVKCTGFYRLGCEMAKANSFCEMGISKVFFDYPNNNTCNDIGIADDITNHAFDCCLSCKGGITDASLNDKCLISNEASLPERARQRCCRDAVARKKSEFIDATTIEPTLRPPPNNILFDELSKLVFENDFKIDKSLGLIFGNNSNATIAPILSGGDSNTSDSSVTPVDVDSTTNVKSNESVETVPLISDILAEHTVIDYNTTVTSESTSTSTESTTVNSPSITTPSIVTARANPCEKGYRRSSESDECEDINECEEDDLCQDSQCFNLPGSFKCCPKGTEIDEKNSKCIYVDYCEKKPCFQSEDDQHWCVNYFTGRECIDKIPDGYKFLKGDQGILESLNKADESVPRFTEITVKNITLPGKAYEKHGLIYLHIPEQAQCDWNFKIDEIWAPNENDKIKENQFRAENSKLLQYNVIKVWVNGQVKPQSIATSITCFADSKPFYSNRVYFTFTTESKA